VTGDRQALTPVLRLAGVCKSYSRAGTAVLAVDGVNLDLLPGTLHALVGASGSGKSTLLGLVAGYDRADSGQLVWDEALNPRSWSAVASVPQALALMPDLTLGENVALVLRLARVPARDADELCELLEVSHLLGRYPRQASLGEQQRVAIIRALCVGPKVLVLDEPTAHQDARRATLVRQGLSDAVRHGSCVLATSHDPVFAESAGLVHVMRDGTLTTQA